MQVVAAVITYEDKILIARRKNGLALAGYWEFPGGKVEANESHEEALVREIKEEFFLPIEVGAYIGRASQDHIFGLVELKAYHASFSINPDLPIVSRDHDKVVLVPKEDLRKYDFAPADIPIVDKLLLTSQTCD